MLNLTLLVDKFGKGAQDVVFHVPHAAMEPQQKRSSTSDGRVARPLEWGLGITVACADWYLRFNVPVSGRGLVFGVTGLLVEVVSETRGLQGAGSEGGRGADA